MNKKSKAARFKPLQKIAEHHEQQAAVIMSSSRKVLNDTEQRLVDLINFREDYTQQIFTSGKRGISGARLQGLYQFVNQLDLAIEQQKQMIVRAQMECEQHTKKWQLKHKKTTILINTVSRFENNERLIGQKQEQKLLDEHNQQRVQFKRNQDKIT